MTADNRTNEPTEAQARAVRKLDNVQAILAGAQASVTDAVRELSLVSAALVAAQGSAPQAESAPKSSYISPSLPGMIRNLWKSDPSENSVRTALKLAGDLIQELIDLKAAPVLPSSGVDEDKLAEAWEQGALWAAVECGAIATEDTAWLVPGDNPYRKEKNDE